MKENVEKILKFVDEKKEVLFTNSNKKVKIFYEEYGEAIAELLKKKYTLREIIKVMNRYFRENNIKRRLTLPFLLEVVKLIKKNDLIDKKEKETKRKMKIEKDKEVKEEKNLINLIREKDPFARF
ncbi:MAG: hypothetical protein QXK45_07260 [Thermofilaceae archaeon]